MANMDGLRPSCNAKNGEWSSPDMKWLGILFNAAVTLETSVGDDERQSRVKCYLPCLCNFPLGNPEMHFAGRLEEVTSGLRQGCPIFTWKSSR